MKHFFTIMVVLLGCLVFLAGCDSSKTKSSRSSRAKSTSKRSTASAPPKVSVRAPRPTTKQPVDEDTADPDEEDPADTDVDPFGSDDSSDDGDGTSTPDEQPKEEDTSPPEEEPEPEVQPEPEEDPDAEKSMTAEEAKQAIIDLDGRVATDEAGNVITVFLNRSSARSKDLEMLEYLPEVTSLNITGLRLDDESLEFIGKMPRLERLYPAHTKITDDALEKLKADKPDLKVYK